MFANDPRYVHHYEEVYISSGQFIQRDFILEHGSYEFSTVGAQNSELFLRFGSPATNVDYDRYGSYYGSDSNVVIHLDDTTHVYVAIYAFPGIEIPGNNEIFRVLKLIVNCTVDWGDGSPVETFTSLVDPRWNHVYETAGNYNIKVNGECPAPAFNWGWDRSWEAELSQDNYLTLIEVKQWGNLLGAIDWGSSFAGCSNLVAIPQVQFPYTNFFRCNLMFEDCSKITWPDSIDNWNMTSVEDISGMFATAHFNKSINNWDVSNIRSFGHLFWSYSSDAVQFNQPLDNWAFGPNTVSLVGLFQSANKFNQPLNNWDVSGIKDFSIMFQNSAEFNQPLSSWDMSNSLDLKSMFNGTLQFNQTLNCWNVAHILTEPTNFRGGSALLSENAPQWGVVDPCPELVIFDCPNGSVWETFKVVTL